MIYVGDIRLLYVKRERRRRVLKSLHNKTGLVGRKQGPKATTIRTMRLDHAKVASFEKTFFFDDSEVTET